MKETESQSERMVDALLLWDSVASTYFRDMYILSHTRRLSDIRKKYNVRLDAEMKPVTRGGNRVGHYSLSAEEKTRIMKKRMGI